MQISYFSMSAGSMMPTFYGMTTTIPWFTTNHAKMSTTLASCDGKWKSILDLTIKINDCN
ncbi:hypothetical protein ACHAWF_016266 [Thalassiosira exigua]